MPPSTCTHTRDTHAHLADDSDALADLIKERRLIARHFDHPLNLGAETMQVTLLGGAALHSRTLGHQLATRVCAIARTRGPHNVKCVGGRDTH